MAVPGARSAPKRHCNQPRSGLRAAAALGITVLLASRHPTPAAQALEPPCDIQTSERVVAIGDIHGAYDQFVGILRTAGLIDRRDRWSGGRARLVQTGDVLDRGSDSRKVVDLLRRLEREAASAGGRVHVLLGNHEFMRLVGDWRYVSAGEMKAFTTADSADLRERVHAAVAQQQESRARAEKRPFDRTLYRQQFMKDIPLGFIEMKTAFEAGEYGRWAKSRVAAVRINDVLFLHGGISERVSSLGCEGVNEAIESDIASLPVPPEEIVSLLASTEYGPLWYRGLASEPEDAFAPALETILQRMKARAVVVGHTPVPNGRIQTRFGGRVVLIDTGMLNGEFYPGGAPSALELRGDTFMAIYLDGRQPLEAPALQPASR
jgi:hypothetical protein